jgi:hypothetical protein
VYLNLGLNLSKISFCGFVSRLTETITKCFSRYCFRTLRIDLARSSYTNIIHSTDSNNDAVQVTGVAVSEAKLDLRRGDLFKSFPGSAIFECGRLSVFSLTCCILYMEEVVRGSNATLALIAQQIGFDLGCRKVQQGPTLSRTS